MIDLLALKEIVRVLIPCLHFLLKQGGGEWESVRCFQEFFEPLKCLGGLKWEKSSVANKNMS